MPTVVAHHNITKGQEHWLKSPKREALFGAVGITNIRTFVNPEDPTRVAVLMDVPDMDAFAKHPIMSDAVESAHALRSVGGLARSTNGELAIVAPVL